MQNEVSKMEFQLVNFLWVNNWVDDIDVIRIQKTRNDHT